jgi:L,D-peptidoglycan transpeptidase YkuD (ErfK/YbiS/YcfS/YnhG family)|tara:strand:- start:1059 stop:1547 length:489 start_codon:yes stop_codon:yes gene_type:complete
MLIKLKNKHTLIIDDFKFKCCVGKNGITINKKEGDNCTPKGKFKIGSIYYRADRVAKPISKIKIKKITKNMLWCDDPYKKDYNKQIYINKKTKGERIYRNDYKYNYFIVIEYNTKLTKPNKGSAIFLHLTKNYQKTAGCIAINKKDFLIMLKIINKNSKIII